jgi:predicted RND superfamily exporter protein
MIVAGIGIVLGLIVLFFGMALLEQERKDKKQKAADRQRQIDAAEGQEALVNALVDGEQPMPFADIRRAKLGAFMVAQGALVVIVCIALFVIHRYLVPIKWYISVPMLVVLLSVSFFTDAFMMGDKSGSTVPSQDGQSEQKVEDCTDNSPSSADDSAEE